MYLISKTSVVVTLLLHTSPLILKLLNEQSLHNKFFTVLKVLPPSSGQSQMLVSPIFQWGTPDFFLFDKFEKIWICLYVFNVSENVLRLGLCMCLSAISVLQCTSVSVTFIVFDLPSPRIQYHYCWVLSHYTSCLCGCDTHAMLELCVAFILIWINKFKA